jgi:hypothetical protein
LAQNSLGISKFLLNSILPLQSSKNNNLSRQAP